MDIKKFNIYFTSDIHGYFYPTTYGDPMEKSIGLFRCANQFKKDKNTIVIDGGDMLQGSAFAYYCQKVKKSAKPMAEIMNVCGYDYITIGNHDFNYGYEYLEEYLNNFNGKCVCENVKKNNIDMFSYDVKTLENGLKVGIVGIVTDYVNVWEAKEHIEGIAITDPFIAAKEALEELKGKVDFTICIYHGGFEKDVNSGESVSSTTEHRGYQICEELSFDLLLTGHQHRSMSGQLLHDTFIVQPREKGKEFLSIEVNIKDGKKNITSKMIKAQGKCQEDIYNKFIDIEQEVQLYLDEVVGELKESLLPEDKITMALKGSKIADFLNEIQLYVSKAQLSAVSLANEVTGFSQKVTRRDIIATYPYPNTLVVLEITGKLLKQAMERSAEYFESDYEGNVVVSKEFLDPKEEHYNFDYYAGITYTMSATKPKGERVSNILYQNRAVNEDDVFTLCINNYRNSGAGGYSMYKNCKVVKEINIEMVELIMSYFEQIKEGRIEN